MGQGSADLWKWTRLSVGQRRGKPKSSPAKQQDKQINTGTLTSFLHWPKKRRVPCHTADVTTYWIDAGKMTQFTETHRMFTQFCIYVPFKWWNKTKSLNDLLGRTSKEKKSSLYILILSTMQVACYVSSPHCLLFRLQGRLSVILSGNSSQRMKATRYLTFSSKYLFRSHHLV